MSFELKFLLDESPARVVAGWLCRFYVITGVDDVVSGTVGVVFLHC